MGTKVRFRLSLRWLLLWTACAPLMLATLAGVFGEGLRLVFCFDFLLITGMLLYVVVAEAAFSGHRWDPR